MDDVREEIVAEVIVLDDTISEETATTIVAEVVDRVLIYTNRTDLVEQYETDLADTTLEDEDWVGYEYPIPETLYTPLAQLIVKMVNDGEGSTGVRDVSSMSDQGQSVSFVVKNVATESLFYDIMPLLDKLIVPSIYDHS